MHGTLHVQYLARAALLLPDAMHWKVVSLSERFLDFACWYKLSVTHFEIFLHGISEILELLP